MTIHYTDEKSSGDCTDLRVKFQRVHILTCVTNYQDMCMLSKN